MLHILFTILKISGIILLVLLALLLLLVLAVLFVPIHYRGECHIHGNTELRASAGWFCRILQISWKGTLAKNNFSDFQSRMVVRVLGFPLGRKKAAVPVKKEVQAEIEEKAESVSEVITEPVPKTAVEFEKDSVEEQEFTEKKQGILETIVTWFYRVLERGKQWIAGIKEKIKTLLQKKEKLQKQFHIWYDYLSNEDNKKAIRFTKEQLKELLRYIKPTRLKGNLIFGLKDPGDTGIVLAFLGMLYSIYGRQIQVCPDFETEQFRLEADLKFRGRIRIYKLLWIALRFYRNREFRGLVDSFPK